MNRPNSKAAAAGGSAEDSAEPIEWEMRPGGMLVQKRDPDAAVATGPLIKIKVSHGLFGHDVSVSAHATFGTFQVLYLLAPSSNMDAYLRMLSFVCSSLLAVLFPFVCSLCTLQIFLIEILISFLRSLILFFSHVC